MDPRRNSRRSDPGKAEVGGLKLRETSPRSPTARLPDSVRLKGLGHGFRVPPWSRGHAEVALRQVGLRMEGSGVWPRRLCPQYLFMPQRPLQ
jgi:hypothetical protein